MNEFREDLKTTFAGDVKPTWFVLVDLEDGSGEHLHYVRQAQAREGNLITLFFYNDKHITVGVKKRLQYRLA